MGGYRATNPRNPSPGALSEGRQKGHPGQGSPAHRLEANMNKSWLVDALRRHHRALPGALSPGEAPPPSETQATFCPRQILGIRRGLKARQSQIIHHGQEVIRDQVVPTPLKRLQLHSQTGDTACNPGTWEVAAERSGAKGKPRPQGKPLFQQTNNNGYNNPLQA